MSEPIDRIYLTLDASGSVDRGVWRAGSTLTGQVCVVVKRHADGGGARVNAVTVQLIGRMHIYWVDERLAAEDTPEVGMHAEIEDYLSTEVTVWRPRAHAARKQVEMMAVGQHVMPFSFRLPDDLPSTHTHSSFGMMKYFAYANVRLEGLSAPVSSITVPFIVDAKPTLYLQELHRLAVNTPKVNSVAAKIRHAWWSPSPSIDIQLVMRIVDTTIVRHGDAIHVDVNVDSLSPDWDVPDFVKVAALLVQETLYVTDGDVGSANAANAITYQTGEATAASTTAPTAATGDVPTNDDAALATTTTTTAAAPSIFEVDQLKLVQQGDEVVNKTPTDAELMAEMRALSTSSARKKEVLVLDVAELAKGELAGRLTLTVGHHWPLTSFPWCNFMDMQYAVHVVAKTQFTDDDVVVKLPIVVTSDCE